MIVSPERSHGRPGPRARVWVHDYQLQLVPAMVRQRLPEATIGFFLHIPFPPVDIFERLPWRRQVLEGLLGADTSASRPGGWSSISLPPPARSRAPGARPRLSSTTAGPIRAQAAADLGRLDQSEAAGHAPEATAAAELLSHMTWREPEHVILGVDRLDYTKGIDLRLRAFEVMLSGIPSSSAGLVHPDRRAQPRRTSGSTRPSGERSKRWWAGSTGGSPVPPGRRPLPVSELSFEDLVGAYLAADVMMITPLRDG